MSLDADFDAVLAMFTTCQDDNTLADLLLCSDQLLSAATEEITFAVEPPQLYYIAVDGYSASQSGAFSLSLSLTTP